MPKVHYVKKARKPNRVVSQEDIDNHSAENPTASYYWWKFMRGGKCLSKKYPRQSKLTRSEFLSPMYEIEEAIADEKEPKTYMDLEELISNAEEWRDQLEELADETEGKFDNMPDGLQQGDTGVLLEERASFAREMAEELEGVIDSAQNLDEDESTVCDWQTIHEELQAIAYQGE